MDASGAARINYTGLTAWDADHKTMPATMTVQDGQIVLTVDDRSARYPVTIDPIAQQAYLKASNTGAGDSFGHSVAISGDTVVVGAFQEDSKAKSVNGNQSDNTSSNSGAAYVFVRSGTAWTQQAYLKAFNTDIFDNFGYSVAISGDTVVVGAPLEDSPDTGVNGSGFINTFLNSGAAYVFVRTGTAWAQQAYLKASNTDSGDNFGYSVAVSGDTVVVGAYQEDSNATGVNGSQSDNSSTNSGAAYVFVRSGTAWSQQAYLKASNTDANDNFGTSVAVSGDTVVVGAYREDSNATGVNGNGSNNSASNSGAAYVFVRSGTAWSQQAYLKASNTDSNDFFGQSVAISGDTVVVGAYEESSNATGVNGSQSNNSSPSSGAAYVFVRTGTAWSQQAYLKASNTDAGDDFSQSVAVSGDTVVVGADLESSNATGVNGNQSNNSASTSGAAYVFVQPPSAANVTIASAPAGLSFTSSGTGCAPGSYTTPQVLVWTPASACQISFTVTQSGTTGTQYVFNHWEDASTNAIRSITGPATDTSYTATFDTQYLLTTAAGTGGNISNGGYFTSGTSTNVTATPSAGYNFVNFTGATTSTSNPLSLTMDAPKSITANFAAANFNITIQSSITGLAFSTTGTGCAPGPYTTPKVLSWTFGSACQVSFTATQAGTTGTQYAFNHWENASTNATRSITAPSANTVYTATFDTQYALSLTINAATLGSVTATSLNCTSTCSNFYTAGTVQSLTPAGTAGYGFNAWTGACTGSGACSVTMTGPQTVTAWFSPVLLTSSLGTKTGAANARVWPVTLTNSGAPGPATAITITSLTLTQTLGVACTPAVQTTTPLLVGTAATLGSTVTANVTINFTGCAGTNRYKLAVGYTANTGKTTGTATFSNQVQ